MLARHPSGGGAVVGTPPAAQVPAAAAPVPQPAPLTVAPPAQPMARRMTTIVVVTKPEAMIEVRDETGQIASGRSPLTFRHPQGAQLQVRAQLTGYVALTTSITTSTDPEQAVTLALHPLKPAAVESKPRARSLDDDKIIE